MIKEDASHVYTIKHGDLILRICILNISNLHLHEEIIPELLQNLKLKIKKDGFQKHPIIVDENSLVVLDGMHRVVALESLGYKRILSCLVDYQNPSIKVGCWYRTLKSSNSLISIFKFETLNVKVSKEEDIDFSELGNPPNVAAIIHSDGVFIFKANFNNICEAYKIVKKIEAFLKNESFLVSFETEEDALKMFNEGKVDAVLLTPKVKKKDVVETALSGDLFPHKTTRHVIPARPLNVKVPLSMLSGCKPLERVNEKLRKELEKVNVRKISGGCIINGRRYEEDIYFFER